jgi:hypothetical protein
VEAAEIFDALFLRQVAPLNESLLAQLVRDESPLGRARLHYFRLNAGPWSRLDEDAPFLAGVGEKPDGANFYPADATREEVDGWMQSLPAGERASATGFFTTIRRAPGGGLMAVPYSVEYQNELIHAARLLREAATATTQPTLKAYLEKRASALLSNDYYESDIAWMELDATIEPTIGPYEVYEDEWFNYKAAVRGVHHHPRRCGDGAKLAMFGARLQGIEDNLPIDPKFRKTRIGGLAPISVVNRGVRGGDANSGVQTAAFNLPNDERVIAGERLEARDVEKRSGSEVQARAGADLRRRAREGGPRRT